MRIRKVINVEGYLITSCGKVWSIESGRFLISSNANGYLKVGLTLSKGIQKNFMVHRLVAEAFIPNISNKPFVNHLDGNKKNNDVNNLEWCTSRENNLHAREFGLIDNKGEKHPMVKLTDMDVISILKWKDLRTQQEVADEFKVSRVTVQGIWNGTKWKHIRRDWV
ncbi:HNH homing endonuclease [Bacillus phage vB_BthS_BMBphi]|nr:HNH homing endonuclease [Bacillus phage vB_BthS_BMBphi]